MRTNDDRTAIVAAAWDPAVPRCGPEGEDGWLPACFPYCGGNASRRRPGGQAVRILTNAARTPFVPARADGRAPQTAFDSISARTTSMNAARSSTSCFFPAPRFRTAAVPASASR